jgi:predicted CoA-binding protein
MRNDRPAIDSFLKLRRIAFVGVSRKEADFSRALWKEFRERGYDLIPVNPNAGMIDSLPAAASISAIDPPPEGVMLLTPATQSLAATREAIQCGVKAIWFYRAVGRGAVSPQAVQLARDAGCLVIAGECPFMFLDPDKFPHSWHRGFKTLLGTMPQ